MCTHNHDEIHCVLVRMPAELPFHATTLHLAFHCSPTKFEYRTACACERVFQQTSRRARFAVSIMSAIERENTLRFEYTVRCTGSKISGNKVKPSANYDYVQCRNVDRDRNTTRLDQKGRRQVFCSLARKQFCVLRQIFNSRTICSTPG